MSTQPSPPPIEEATFAGGCFWCLEAAFNSLQGVLLAESGYSNGEHPRPDYESVCSGRTGHAEVVRVRFDPTLIRYEQLLEVFFLLHDPTTLNRQGNDVGTQYRSGVYTHSPDQAKQALALIQNLNASGAYGSAIVTEVQPVHNYHPAETYHQGYVNRNPHQGYCAMVVRPKLQKFQRTFSEWLKPDGSRAG
jgi:peptide-methionine (S)-S-oxide reductase